MPQTGVAMGLFGGKTKPVKGVMRSPAQGTKATNSATITNTRDTGGYAVADYPTQQTPRGAGIVATSGDSPVSHVTPDPVFLTPSTASRGNRQWEGNITGHTTPRTIKRNLIQHIVPKLGFARNDSVVNGNPSPQTTAVVKNSREALNLYRHDAPIPSFVSGFNSGQAPAIDPVTKSLDVVHFTDKNPSATQNQDPNPRLKSVKQGT